MDNPLPLVVLLAGLGYIGKKMMDSQASAPGGGQSETLTGSVSLNATAKILPQNPIQQRADNLNQYTGNAYVNAFFNDSKNQGGPVLKKQTPGVSIVMEPEEAYSLVQKGQYNQVKNAHLSRWYSWYDFLRTESNPKNAELSAMQNGQRLGFVLDLLCDRVGHKVGLNSWYRSKAHQIAVYHSQGKYSNIPLASRHIVGDGADITATSDKTSLYRIARSMPEIRRIGYPTNGSNFLHLDLMPNAPAGYQQIFVDNQVNQSNFRNVPLLKPGNAAAYGT